MLQAVCTRAGELRALLVLGHRDGEPFSHTDEWPRLHELLDVLLFSSVKGSNLARFVAFTELLQVMTTPADTVTFVAQWLPALLVGAPGIMHC